MCMKNVNLNAISCDFVSSPDAKSISLGNIRKKFHLSVENGKRMISQVSMAIFISATQTKDKLILEKTNPDLVFVFKEKYEIRVRLTETISGDFKDLNTFTIEPSKNFDSNGLCRDTFTHVQLCLNSNVVLPDIRNKERFVVKLLIRRFDKNRMQDDDWTVQSIIPIEFDNISNETNS